ARRRPGMKPLAALSAVLLISAAIVAAPGLVEEANAAPRARPVASEPLRGAVLMTADLADGDPSQYGTCSSRSARVQRWTPASGPPAGFIADLFLAPTSNEWIGLGYDDDGYWAAEIT